MILRTGKLLLSCAQFFLPLSCLNCSIYASSLHNSQSIKHFSSFKWDLAKFKLEATLHGLRSGVSRGRKPSSIFLFRQRCILRLLKQAPSVSDLLTMIANTIHGLKLTSWNSFREVLADNFRSPATFRQWICSTKVSILVCTRLCRRSWDNQSYTYFIVTISWSGY